METVSAVAAEEAYQDITAEYQTVLGVDSATFLNAPDNYFNGDHMAIRYYHMYHGDSFYYAFTLDYGRYNDYNEAEIHNEPDCELSKIFTI